MTMIPQCFNPLPDDKKLALSKLKAVADAELNVIQNNKNVFHKIENIVGRGENAGFQQLLRFPHYFLKYFFLPERQKSSLYDKG